MTHTQKNIFVCYVISWPNGRKTFKRNISTTCNSHPKIFQLEHWFVIGYCGLELWRLKPSSTIYIMAGFFGGYCGLVLWCLTPLSTIFQLYHGSQFYWWGKLGVFRENYQPAISHWQTLSHNVSYRPFNWRKKMGGGQDIFIYNIWQQKLSIYITSP